MYEYNISGYFREGEEIKHFNMDIEARNEQEAMQIACGRIVMAAEAPVKLECIHYE